MFGDLLNETLTLRKKSNGQMHSFRANVQPSRSLILTDFASLSIEEGDTIERPLRTSVEMFNFASSFHSNVRFAPSGCAICPCNMSSFVFEMYKKYLRSELFTKGIIEALSIVWPSFARTSSGPAFINCLQQFLCPAHSIRNR